MKERALLLVGSPHASGASAMLGAQLLDRLPTDRWDTHTLRIYPTLSSDDRWRDLIDAVHGADLIVLSAPLYVDALPAAVTRAFERLAAGPAVSGARPGQRFMVLMNCGFLEARQCEVALSICNRFAREAGLQWAGGLSVGVAGRMTPYVQEALDLAAAALDAGDQVPSAAVALASKPPMPAWLYVVVASAFMWFEARKHGAHRRLGARPYVPAMGGGRE